MADNRLKRIVAVIAILANAVVVIVDVGMVTIISQEHEIEHVLYAY
jgi:hypothetical protein